MPAPPHPTRRDFLLSAAASTVAASLPTVLPSRVLGRDGNVPPGEKIALGVIGIGPRCTYDLKAMLQFGDIQCVAIADVQASRRDSHLRRGAWQQARDSPAATRVRPPP